MTAPTGCAWTGVSNNTSWLTVTSGASGSGNGTVAFSASANPNTSTAHRHAHDRRADVLGEPGGRGLHVRALAGQSVGCRRRWYGVDGGDRAHRLRVDGRQQQHAVADGDEWREWQRDGTVAFSATANPNGTPRTGTLDDRRADVLGEPGGRACTYALSPASQSVVAGGGTGSTAVTAPTGCAWTGVSNNTAWLTVTSGASGSGNGTVAFSASANPNTSTRTGTLTIGGQTFSVNAGGRGLHLRALAGESVGRCRRWTGSTAVTAPTGCAWTGVSNNTSWLTVTSGASGSGNGTVAFSATANPNGTPRTGTLTIGGQTFSVNQAAVGCTYALSPASQSVVAGGGTGSTAVTAPTGCAWTGVSNNTPWLTVTSGASGTGNGTVAFSATANPNGTPRTGTLTIGGQTFSVNQAAVGCTYALSPASQSVVAGGGTGSTAVTAPTGCAWTGVSNNTSWLTVTSGASGTGNGTVAFSATANPNGTPRTGTLTIGGQTFSVNQAAVGCTYALSPASQSVVAGGGTGSTAVTAPTGCAWTGVSNNTAMADGDERREWHRQWHGRLQRVGESEHEHRAPGRSRLAARPSR